MKQELRTIKSIHISNPSSINWNDLNGDQNLNRKILSLCKTQGYLKLLSYFMQTEYTGPIQFEQSNREHDQITVKDGHKRLRNMVSKTNWLWCDGHFNNQSHNPATVIFFPVGTDHAKVNWFQGKTCIMGLPNIIKINESELWVTFKSF